MTLGQMRNFCCFKANGDIIVHMDDDDIYAPDWISKSVVALTSSVGNLTGLSSAYFKSPEQWYLYKWPGTQPYVIGASFCYYRSLWLNNPFKSITEGEDKKFQVGAIIRPHSYIEGFTATLHGGNTCSHKAVSFMQAITPAPSLTNQ